MRRLSSLVMFVLSAALVVPATMASAAPPPNDTPATAIRMTPPQTVTGTLVDAGLDPVYGSNCAESDTSVWYRFTAPNRGAIVIQLDSGGDMDATLDLYQRVRSKLDYADCAETDSKGIGTIDNDELEPGAEYAIRVGKQAGSVADSFQLRVLIPSPPPSPPGKELPAKGARGKVDRLVNAGDAYWMHLSAGRTMRLSLATKGCTSLSVYGPGTKSFDGSPVKRLRCGGYRLFTPSESGRHFFVVEAGRSRDVQSYRLQVAPAHRDDTTPGVFIRNNAKVHGHLNGHIDSTDLYRFDVTSRSTLSLSVSGGPDLRLVTDDGRRLGSGDFIDRTVRAGRYYVAAEGSGRYVLRRVSRTITHASLSFNGHHKAVTRPGATASLALHVRPDVAGRGVITVERLDPIDGWQFLHRYRVGVSAGRGTVSFHPPSIGHYRASAKYLGSHVAAPDDTGTSKLIVRSPLVQ
jgi:hypothetical protein